MPLHINLAGGEAIMTRYNFTDKFNGVVMMEIVTDLASSAIKSLYSLWEGRGCVQSFTDFIRETKPGAIVIDMEEVDAVSLMVN
jgi:hypothetical protein